MEKTTYFGNLRKNCMGTTSFDMRIPGMRKTQNFIVYPMQSNDEGKTITIQSDTRIGRLNLKNGEGFMSCPHSSGAYFHHMQFDKLTKFQLRNVDLDTLKLFIYTTQSKKAGNNGIIYCDNSNANKSLTDEG